LGRLDASFIGGGLDERFGQGAAAGSKAGPSAETPGPWPWGNCGGCPRASFHKRRLFAGPWLTAGVSAAGGFTKTLALHAGLWLRRNRKRLWYSIRDIPADRIRRALRFAELAGASAA